MIHVITTGGTIEGLDSELQENEPINIRSFLEAANLSKPFSIEKVLQKDSRDITEEDRANLILRIKASESDQILITHGTYTMVETAKYLGQANLEKTIVLVGSFILGSSHHSDAAFNLGFAISSLQFLKPDVYIAMNGTVFNWENVTKNLETNKFETKRK